jgi:hypothetical protein
MRRIAALPGRVLGRRKICEYKNQFGHDVVW